MITRLGSGGPWEEPYGYSRVVRAGDLVLSAGCTSTAESDAYTQTVAAFRTALTALERAGASPEQVVRTRMYIVDRADADAAGRAHGEIFGAVRPAATLVIVAGLLDPAMRVEVEVEAYVGP